MERSDEAPQLRDKSENFHQLSCPDVSVNPIFHANLHHDKVTPTCMDACKIYRSPCRSEHMNQEWTRQPARVLQRAEKMQSRKQDHFPAWMNLPQQPLDGCLTPAEIMQGGAKGECSYWGCGPDPRGAAEPTQRNATGEDEYRSQPQSDDEEELELPLPLKADNEWQNQNPLLHPHNYYFQHMMDVRHCCFPEEGQCNTYSQAFHGSAPHLQKWNNPNDWPQHGDRFRNDSMAQSGVSVNVPQFSVPPVEGLSQVSVQKLHSAAAEETVSTPQEKRRTISLPEECRNVFITYSSDVSLEMVSFVEFLTKHGFRPAIDLFDNPIRRMDINKWSDIYLKDPSTLVIIAISPKYKNDIEGSEVDSHGLHTKYIHSLKHVPSWLQNTHVYRWPQDTEDLLLRLLKEERYVPPSVPVELTLIIRPVTTSAASMM